MNVLDEIRSLRRELADLRRRIVPSPVRLANVLAPIIGFGRGVLTEDLTSDGTATLALERWDAELEQWVSAEKSVTVRVGLPLADGDAILEDKVCWAVRLFGLWWVIAAQC